ncbi:hypothetical protein [Aquimonas sp.]|jgi:hypothetical protein|uniref:hypothetical protein n=1 Tax=Aquimonas sp. TaxID=1872588 RepID=UPI0037C12386
MSLHDSTSHVIDDIEAAADCASRFDAAATVNRLPWAWLAQALAALGPLVCLHRRFDQRQLAIDAAPLLAGLRLQVQAEIDSSGPREALRFVDAHGVAVCQLCLLPDSDFLAWERLLALLQQRRQLSVAQAPLCQPPWLIRWRWRARAGRFVATSDLRLALHGSASISACGERSIHDWCQRCQCGPCAG